jgi:hypothetical protein
MNDAERRENSSASMDPAAPVVDNGEAVFVAVELLLLAKGQHCALPLSLNLLSLGRGSFVVSLTRVLFAFLFRHPDTLPIGPDTPHLQNSPSHPSIHPRKNALPWPCAVFSSASPGKEDKSLQLTSCSYCPWESPFYWPPRVYL